MALANEASVLREAMLLFVEPSRSVAKHCKIVPRRVCRHVLKPSYKQMFIRLPIPNALQVAPVSMLKTAIVIMISMTMIATYRERAHFGASYLLAMCGIPSRRPPRPRSAPQPPALGAREKGMRMYTFMCIYIYIYVQYIYIYIYIHRYIYIYV